MPKRRTNNLEDIPGNDREEREFEGNVRFSKPKSNLAGEVRDIGNNLFREILLPAAQSTLMDFLSNGISELIFGSGDRGYSPKRRDRGGSGRYSYNRRYRSRDRKSSYRGSGGGSSRYSRLENRRNRNAEIDDIFFDDRNDANYVLGRMLEEIAEFGGVTVGFMYSLCKRNSSVSNEQWGWYNLSGVRVEYAGPNGYVIALPDPEYLK